MNIPKGTDQFKTALVYANYLHRHQTRKVNRIPYIADLLSVTALVLENRGSEDEAKRRSQTALFGTVASGFAICTPSSFGR